MIAINMVYRNIIFKIKIMINIIKIRENKIFCFYFSFSIIKISFMTSASDVIAQTFIALILDKLFSYLSIKQFFINYCNKTSSLSTDHVNNYSKNRLFLVRTF